MGPSAKGQVIDPRSPPKRLYLAVNPHGGRKSGPAVLRQVKPIFDAAGIDLNIFETEYAGHAREFIRDLDFSEVNGFCAVGGDGTMHEVVNGLLSRPDNSQIPIGLIPAGIGIWPDSRIAFTVSKPSSSPSRNQPLSLSRRRSVRWA